MVRSLKEFWTLMEGQRMRYGAAILAMVFSIFFGYGIPLVCQAVLDGVLGNRPDALPPFVLSWVEKWGGMSAFAAHLWIGAAALVTCAALGGLFGYLRGRMASTASELIARRLRDRLFDHLQNLPSRYFAKAETGDLVQRCTSDVTTVQTFLSNEVVEIGRGVLMVLGVLPIMLWLDARMALVALAIVPVIIAFSIVFFIWMKETFKQADEAEGKLTAVLQENLTGIRVVRAFARQEFEEAKFAERNGEYRDRNFRLIKLLAWYWSLSDLLCFGQNLVVLGLGARWVMRGEMTIGTLFAFMTYVNMFLWPVRQLGRMLTGLGKTQVALGRIDEILKQPREDQGEAALPALPEVKGDVAFADVRFGFTPEKPVLHGISVEVKAGQTLALVGPSGSGKSTLMQLLLRLYEPDGGVVRIDGQDIRTFARRSVRGQIGVVMQEPFLFSKTLRENIKLGAPHASDEEMEEAAMAACIHDAIRGFESGYDTMVGERGVTLSGGQRQRVAIARAILRDPPILVLDDALSAVDTHTETLILGALKNRRGKRTTLVIAHRLSTLMHADRILVLDQGRVVQQGTHASLVKEDGLYQRLWHIQTELEEDLKADLETPAEAAGTQL